MKAQISSSAFQSVVKILAGQAPDVADDGPQDPVPEGYCVVGTAGEQLKMIAMQCRFHGQLYEKAVKSSPVASGPDGYAAMRALVPKLEDLNARGFIVTLLNHLFLEGLFYNIPEGERTVGLFGVYKDWQIASPADVTRVLSNESSPGSEHVRRFFGTLTSICCGKRIYDAGFGLAESMSGDVVVGTLDAVPAQQMCAMLDTYNKVHAAHDPYNAFEREVCAFHGRSFNEYAKWRHVSLRLGVMVSILRNFLNMGVMDHLNKELLRSYLSSKHPGGGRMNFIICEDWKIVLVSDDDPRVTSGM